MSRLLNLRFILNKIAAGPPRIVERCVSDIIREHGYDKSQAYAICVGHLHDTGHLKKGTMKLTQKGRESPAEHRPKPRCR